MRLLQLCKREGELIGFSLALGIDASDLLQFGDSRCGGKRKKPFKEEKPVPHPGSSVLRPQLGHRANCPEISHELQGDQGRHRGGLGFPHWPWDRIGISLHACRIHTQTPTPHCTTLHLTHHLHVSMDTCMGRGQTSS